MSKRLLGDGRPVKRPHEHATDDQFPGPTCAWMNPAYDIGIGPETVDLRDRVPEEELRGLEGRVLVAGRHGERRIRGDRPGLGRPGDQKRAAVTDVSGSVTTSPP